MTGYLALSVETPETTGRQEVAIWDREAQQAAADRFGAEQAAEVAAILDRIGGEVDALRALCPKVHKNALLAPAWVDYVTENLNTEQERALQREARNSALVVQREQDALRALEARRVKVVTRRGELSSRMGLAGASARTQSELTRLRGEQTALSEEIEDRTRSLQGAQAHQAAAEAQLAAIDANRMQARLCTLVHLGFTVRLRLNQLRAAMQIAQEHFEALDHAVYQQGQAMGRETHRLTRTGVALMRDAQIIDLREKWSASPFFPQPRPVKQIEMFAERAGDDEKPDPGLSPAA